MERRFWGGPCKCPVEPAAVERPRRRQDFLRGTALGGNRLFGQPSLEDRCAHLLLQIWTLPAPSKRHRDSASKHHAETWPARQDGNVAEHFRQRAFDDFAIPGRNGARQRASRRPSDAARRGFGRFAAEADSFERAGRPKKTICRSRLFAVLEDHVLLTRAARQPLRPWAQRSSASGSMMQWPIALFFTVKKRLDMPFGVG